MDSPVVKVTICKSIRLLRSFLEGRTMRTKWMLATVALASATAAASPSVPFTTVFDSTATFGSDSSSLFFPDQVVIGPGGVVYTNALMNDFTNDIIYSTPSGNT